jgi:DNA-binding transcriptional LysR family regulator
MDLTRLRGFFTVVRSGGFTEAARRLRLTQPAISQQVKNLEEELGVQLLRRARPVVLTPEGELLYDMAESIFAEVDRVHAVFDDLKTNKPALLNLAANQSTAMHILPEKLTTFTKRFPMGGIAIHNMRTGEIVEAVADGTIDVGMVLIDPGRPDITARPVIPYEMVLITPREHPLAKQRQVTLDDIARYPFISYTKTTETRQLIDEPFRKGHQRTQIRMALGSTDLIITYVAMGYGIAIVHNLNLARNRPKDLAVRPLRRYFPPQHLHLIWRAEGEPAFPAREFVALF